MMLLAGRPGGAVADPGRRVCSCFGVGVNQIRAAVSEGCDSVAAIGEKTRAGTNCGSCRPEIARIIADERRVLAEAAE
jgi:assimilatory nitrate reductase catalytic subunit